jgi:hypothetical protein
MEARPPGVAAWTGSTRRNGVCIRTKTFRPDYPNTGGKFARYRQWSVVGSPPNQTVKPDMSVSAEVKAYDYYYLQNTLELGNNWLNNTNPASVAFLQALGNALGDYNANGYPQPGKVIATELNAPLPSVFAPVQAAAMQARVTFLSTPPASCPVDV